MRSGTPCDSLGGQSRTEAGSFGSSLAVHIVGTDRSFSIARGASLLAGMLAKGDQPLEYGCRNGGCGVCRIRVLSGTFEAQVMNRDRVTIEEQAQNIVLACRITPLSDITFEALPLRAGRCDA